MWGKRKNEILVANAVADVLREPVPAKPEPVLVGDELVKYATVAQAIGWTPGSLLEQKLKNFLAENALCVYPYDAVEAYLNHKFGTCDEPYPQYTKWGWRPLRTADLGWEHDMFHLRRNGSILTGGHYHGPVPLEVLMTIQKVAENFPEVRFFISDVPREEGRTKDDPFLAISALGMGFLIVERWDEPGFRM